MDPIVRGKPQASMLPKIELTWFVLLLLATLTYCVATDQDVLSISVLMSGTMCVVLTALGRKEGYLVGLFPAWPMLGLPTRTNYLAKCG